MSKHSLKLVEQFDYRLINQFDVCKKSTKCNPQLLAGCNIHDFLDYCYLLKKIKTNLDNDKKQYSYDSYVTFLCGGYVIFEYLNLMDFFNISSEKDYKKPIIFGGLNHNGNINQQLFKKYLKEEIIQKRLLTSQNSFKLLILDEVKSGSQLNLTFKLIKEIMKETCAHAQFNLTIHFYAISNILQPEEEQQLKTYIKEKDGKVIPILSGQLNIKIKHLCGTLLSYDNDIIRGVTNSSGNADYSIFEIPFFMLILTCVKEKSIFNYTSINANPFSSTIDSLKHEINNIKKKACTKEIEVDKLIKLLNHIFIDITQTKNKTDTNTIKQEIESMEKIDASFFEETLEKTIENLAKEINNFMNIKDIELYNTNTLATIINNLAVSITKSEESFIKKRLIDYINSLDCIDCKNKLIRI